MKKTTDFSFQDDTAIIKLYPISAEAKAWTKKHLLLHSWQSRKEIIIEKRYISAIKKGIKLAGLSIEPK